MSRWPIIRHIRALKLVFKYVKRAVFIWKITDQNELETNTLFKSDRDKAREIWKGKV